MSYNLKYRQFNEYSILIEWPASINEKILKDLLNFKNRIESLLFKQIVEVNNTYNSLLIIYNIAIENINDKIFALKALYADISQYNPKKSVCWQIPVCYDDQFAVDIHSLVDQLNIPKSEIIEIHSSKIYTVYFIGFLPGFLYLGGLDSLLHVPRKSTPSLRVKKGAVAIGGKQTGIYPQDSPGGWHIIGNSPIDFFDIKSEQPCFARPGDKIKFSPVDFITYTKIQAQIKKNTYLLNSFEIDD